MTGVITTGNFAKLLWPGIKKIWGDAYYREHPEEWKMLFDEAKSNQAYEEDILEPGFGIAPVKSEGSATKYDSHSQGYVTRYTNVAYALGYIVTREEIDDCLYPKVSQNRTRSLAFSFRQTKELVAAGVYNNATNPSFIGGDGQSLLSANHQTFNGGIQSNVLPIAADLSEKALEDMVTLMRRAKNEQGLQISLTPKDLKIPPELEFEAARILKSTLQANTADNNINVLKSYGIIPKIVMCHYFSDPDQWLVGTNMPEESGMKCYKRIPIEFSQDNDYDTMNFKAKGYERYSFGWTDWRANFGSPGV